MADNNLDQQVIASVKKLNADTDTWHDIVHGTQPVDTESGPVLPVAKRLDQIQAEMNTQVGDLATAVADVKAIQQDVTGKQSDVTTKHEEVKNDRQAVTAARQDVEDRQNDVIARQQAIDTAAAQHLTDLQNKGDQQNTRVTNTGNAQHTRVQTEGNTQTGNVTTEGDDQVARVIAQGNAQVNNVKAEGDTQAQRVTTIGDQKVADATTQADRAATESGKSAASATLAGQRATTAGQHKTGAETAEQGAQQAESNTQQLKADVQQLKTDTQGFKNSAEQAVVDATEQAGIAGSEVQKLSHISNPNLIINGCFTVNQRGNTASVPTTSTYVGDRFKVVATQNATGAGTGFTAVMPTPSGGMSGAYHGYVNVSAAGTTTLRQTIEPTTVKQLSGRNVTVSFYARARSITSNGTVGAYFAVRGSNGSYRGFSMDDDALTATWKKFVGRIRVQSVSDLSAISRADLDFGFTLPSGGSIDITSVKLEVGSTATPFVPDDVAINLERCQRFYEPVYLSMRAGRPAIGLYLGDSCTYSTTKRVTPTLIWKSTQLHRNLGPIGIYHKNVNGFTWQCDVTGGDPVLFGAVYVADAEL
ncbi:hypothetical protein [Sansalvadorimonas verongulae]|uniref:hypothetical protein n=1 Tax=Sansalvadorimonas verongulae TaxID=2172824 RepID=UPI0012BCBD38|nr:hypothetical protein [Sansalvadorimonas verongulae]MTI13116.1 hypothetical protein [Sansalvadorimonas verongulae]